MKAALCTCYGAPETVLIVELPTPRPKANEVVVRSHASTVASADWRLRSGCMPRGFGLISRLIFGLRRLRQPILGTEFSGSVYRPIIDSIYPLAQIAAAHARVETGHKRGNVVLTMPTTDG